MLEMFILLLLIFLNGLFVMAEIALVSARKTRLENLSDNGDEKARSALRLAESPELFLSTAQIGITLVAILTGFYSGEKFSADLKPYIERISILKPYAGNISTGLILVFVTLLSITFGELIPKRIGLLRAEQIARLVARPVGILSLITHPIVWLLNNTSNLFFRFFQITPSEESTVTEDEIKAIINEGTEQGTIEEAEQEIIERVFHLGDRNITSLMTNRSDIIWFDINLLVDDINKMPDEKIHSIYPVCDGAIDNIKGIVSLKHIVKAKPGTALKDVMTTGFFVPENNSAYKLLERFKELKSHYAFIVDEYGTLQGLVTLNDILDAIVGEVPHLDEELYEIVERKDGSYLIDAQIPFYNFLSYFEHTDYLDQDEQQFNTLAGFILDELERIPQTGDH